jgi:hypothetical protein
MPRDLQDLGDIRRECVSCYHGAAIVDLVDEYLPTLQGSQVTILETEIDGAPVTVWVECDEDADGCVDVVGPCFGETAGGGLISRQALIDLGLGRDNLRDEMEEQARG